MQNISLINVLGVRVYKTGRISDPRFKHLEKSRENYDYHYDLEISKNDSQSKNTTMTKTIYYSEKKHKTSFLLIDREVKKLLKELSPEDKKILYDIPKTLQYGPRKPKLIKFPKPVQLMGYFAKHKLPEGTFIEVTENNSTNLYPEVEVICIGRRNEKTEKTIGETPELVFEKLQDKYDYNGRPLLKLVNKPLK